MYGIRESWARCPCGSVIDLSQLCEGGESQVMISSSHKNTRDGHDDEDLEEQKNPRGLHSLVLLGRTGIILIGGDERSIIEMRRERSSHL
jgi:hypothetical protein